MARQPRKVRRGENPFADGLNRLREAVDENVATAAVRLAGLELVRAAKLQLSKPGTGREYRRKGGKVHKASAPGQPPAVDTGALRNSIGMGVVGGVVRVGSGLAKAPLLEFGTLDDGGVLAPRPFMRPALEDARAAMGQVTTGELQKAVRKL